MLKQRLVKQIKIVSIYDGALLDVPDDLMREYVSTRDISILEKEIEKLTEKPTIFYCWPLKIKEEYLVDAAITMESEAAWSIFKKHVTKADNFQDELGRPIIVPDGPDKIKDDCREKIPRDIVQEIAGVIIGKANESTRPFMMPDTWLRTRIQSRAIRAMRANIEIATEQDTK